MITYDDGTFVDSSKILAVACLNEQFQSVSQGGLNAIHKTFRRQVMVIVMDDLPTHFADLPPFIPIAISIL